MRAQFPTIPRMLIMAALVVAGLDLMQPSAGAGVMVTSERLAGADRYETAAEIARNTFDPERDAAFLAAVVSGERFPDALVASTLAGLWDGPVLLTPPGGLHPATAEVLAELGITDVDLIGGTAVLSEQVRRDAQALGQYVIRYGGATRYDTALGVNRLYHNTEVAPRVTRFLLVSGESFPDALTVGPLAFQEQLPLLLTTPEVLSPQVHTFLDEFPSAREAVVVGGPGAVSEAVIGELRAKGVAVLRVGGATRQGTAVAVGEYARDEYGWQPSTVVLARGDAFPDALAASAFAGKHQAPILLTVDPHTLGEPTRAYLEDHAVEVSHIVALGDETAISDATLEEARQSASLPSRVP